MLYIRTDGNAEIGTGHVMRCLSIATTYQKSGGDCIFITADEQMKPLLDEQGFFIICLNSVWNDLDKETEKMEQLINKRKIEKLLIDSYFVTPEYLERLNKLTYLIYMNSAPVVRQLLCSLWQIISFLRLKPSKTDICLDVEI